VSRHEELSKSSHSEEDMKERMRHHELSRRDRQSHRDKPDSRSSDRDYSGRISRHDDDYSTKSDSKSGDRDNKVGKPRQDHDYLKKLDAKGRDRDAREGRSRNDHDYSRKTDSRRSDKDEREGRPRHDDNHSRHEESKDREGRSRDHDYSRKSDSRRSDKDDREGRTRHDNNHSRHEESKNRNIDSEISTRVEQAKKVNHRRGVHKMSEKEREERLRQMQLDAELHEKQRWKRLKKAAEDDAKEVDAPSSYRGKNFLDETQKCIYGAEKGGSTTIEESVRRRAYFSQGGMSTHESNAFRR
jgi:hypothetical protein